MDLKTESYIHAWTRVKGVPLVSLFATNKTRHNVLFICTFLPVVQEAAVLAFASHGFPASGCPFLMKKHTDYFA